MDKDGIAYFDDQFRRLIGDAERSEDSQVRTALFMLAAEYRRLARLEDAPPPMAAGFSPLGKFAPTPNLPIAPLRPTAGERK